jgi:hypothetical protein
VFWQPGTVADFSSDQAGVLYVSPGNGVSTLTAADPGQGSGSFRITMNGVYTKLAGDDAVTLEAGNNQTFIDFPRSGGLSSSIVIQPIATP